MPPSPDRHGGEGQGDRHRPVQPERACHEPGVFVAVGEVEEVGPEEALSRQPSAPEQLSFSKLNV